MDIETYRNFCISKPGVTEEFPFDNETLVFKVGGKMFALTNVDAFDRINLKCAPDWALELREQYPDIVPGWHMNKNHWNSINTSGSLTDKMIFELIDHSYSLIVDGLPKKIKLELDV